MKLFFYILLFLSVNVSAQNLYTNAPGKVYPVLEEFITENFKLERSTLADLMNIDSINVVSLPLHVKDLKILQPYGLCHERPGGTYVIEIDASLIGFPYEFNKVLKHELGHVFSLPHIETHHLAKNHPLRFEIMSSFHSHYLLEFRYEEDPELWKRVNQNYYKNLKASPK
jgi:hypothetical protein